MQSPKSYIFLNIAISILFLLSIVIMYNNKEDKIDNILKNNLRLSLMQYRSVMKHYHILADNVKNIIINSPEIIDIFKKAKDASKEERVKIREALRLKLDSRYNYLKKLGFKQIHFHLPNNISFLRMHKVSSFGDDLTNVRYSVKMVNKTLQPINGFEEGRVIHGFRFVYPLFDENNTHIGSVEASISSSAFRKILYDTFFSDIHFLIKKDIVNKKIWPEDRKKYYINSAEISTFYTEMSSDIEHLNRIRENRYYIDKVEENIVNNIPFALYDGLHSIISFLPIKNIEDKKTIAYFAIYSQTEEIKSLIFTYRVFNLLLILIFIVIIYFIRREYLAIQIREKIKKELVDLNATLAQRVDIEIAKNRKKEQQFIEQSRLAQMGEMLSMIAHQWRQPLSAISSTAVGLELKGELDKLDNKFVIKQAQNISKYSQHLSQTINDFRDFFKSDKKKISTSFDEILESVLNIVEVSITNKNIDIIKECEDKEIFHTYSNEVKQVILNLLKNAEDVLVDRDIEDPYIEISTYHKDDKHIIRIKDNGGGISDDIADKIFNPYFSTKTEKNGTGLGLYMSKTIIEEHCKGELDFIKNRHGAIFEIALPDLKEEGVEYG